MKDKISAADQQEISFVENQPVDFRSGSSQEKQSQQDKNQSDLTYGRLFVAATPIGNLQDMSDRLKETLAAADLIAAEDTRHTLKLLNFLGLQKKMTSYHAHNWRTKGSKILELLK